MARAIGLFCLFCTGLSVFMDISTPLFLGDDASVRDLGFSITGSKIMQEKPQKGR